LLQSKHNINGFFFRDQSFTTDRKHALSICTEIETRKLDVAWYTEARVNEVDSELLQAMKNAGCKRISFGVETGNSSMLTRCKAGVNLQSIRKAFELTKNVGILRTANVIVGWPEDTQTTLKQTYNFVLSLEPDGVNCNTLVPYPQTNLWTTASLEHLIISQDFDRYTPDNCVIRTRELTTEQLCEEKKKMVEGFSRYQLRKSLVNIATGKRKHVSLGAAKQLLKRTL
jgi:radical SAM superfamily enzyme YgiQ (UPF0313 family)